MLHLFDQNENDAQTIVDSAANGVSQADLIATLITLAAVFVGAVLVHLIFGSIINRVSKRATGRVRWGAIIARAMGKPLLLAVWVIAAILMLDVGLDLAHWLMPSDADLTEIATALRNDVFPPARTFVIILALTLFGAGFVRGVQHELEEALAAREGGGDITAVQGLGSIGVVIVWVLGVLTALGGVGVNTTAVLAVLGLSSAGLAFAAKDLLANFFGGIMLLFNRPFNTGDYVVVKGTEGAIERIGLYSTHIRGADKRVYWVPNQAFTAATVENMSRRTHRQIKEVIGLRYDDIAAVGPICADILTCLQGHEAIDQNQTCRVAFSGYGESTVNITITAFSAETSAGAFTELHSAIMLEVARIIARHGADFAFPTVTVLKDG